MSTKRERRKAKRQPSNHLYIDVIEFGEISDLTPDSQEKIEAMINNSQISHSGIVFSVKVNHQDKSVNLFAFPAFTAEGKPKVTLVPMVERNKGAEILLSRFLHGKIMKRIDDEFQELLKNGTLIIVEPEAGQLPTKCKVNKGNKSVFDTTTSGIPVKETIVRVMATKAIRVNPDHPEIIVKIPIGDGLCSIDAVQVGKFYSLNFSKSIFQKVREVLEDFNWKLSRLLVFSNTDGRVQIVPVPLENLQKIAFNSLPEDSEIALASH